MVTTSEFKVQIGEFEGPLDALLRLIEEKKLHINQVSLASVADSFLSHVQSIAQNPEHKSVMADFIYVASTLMLIKSLSLLPKLEVTPEETASIEELERRLALYKEIKNLSGGVKNLWDSAGAYSRQEGEPAPVFSPSPEITVQNLVAAAERVLASLPVTENRPEVVVQKVLSLKDAIDDLVGRMQRALKMSFKDFVKNKTERVNVIVSFLGLLELVRQGTLEVEQRGHFEDIHIETINIDTPRYN